MPRTHKTILVALIAVGLLLPSLALAQVYNQSDGTWKMAGFVEKYDPYEAPKADGKIGRLYVIPHDKKKEREAKKLYVTSSTTITDKGGAKKSIGDIKPDTVVMVHYSKEMKADNLILKSIEIQ